MQVFFHLENFNFSLSNKASLIAWIKYVLLDIYNRELATINIIFCSDSYLLEINNKYLNHNYFTDIITFDNSIKDEISGDLYISIERVKDNAKELKVNFNSELHRVIIHGVLHLCGFNDKTKLDIEQMRNQENLCLSKLKI